MVVFTESTLQNCIIHTVGNQSDENNFLLTNKTIPLSDELEETLHRFLIKPFKTNQSFYKFHHHSQDLARNDVYFFVKSIFENPYEFTSQSKKIAEYLQEKSQHPAIKNGECCITFFENIIIEGEPVNAIGIFKFERKDTFLKLINQTDQYNIKPEEGLNIDKSDKGCIIFETEKDSGYRLLLSDQNNYDAKYWPEQFLNVKPDTNESYFTGKTFEAVNSFANEMVEHNDSAPARMEMLDRTAKYFDQKESFDMDDFVEEVIQTDEYKEKFKDYKKEYDIQNELPEKPQFTIDKDTSKKSVNKLNNTIKLDGQIQIKLNFNNENQVNHYLEKGFDEKKQMSFYKVYFREES